MTDTKEKAAAEIVRSELHTYPDGSAIVGTPPWPEKSPLQIAAESAERVGVPAAAPEPAPAPSQPSNVVTADQVETSSEPQPIEPAPAAAAPAPTTSRKR